MERRSSALLVGAGLVAAVILALVLGSALSERRPGGSGPTPTAPPPTSAAPSATVAASTPTATSSASRAPTATPTPTPIALPSAAEISAPRPDVAWARVGGSRLFVSTDRGTTWQERSAPATELPSPESSFLYAFISESEGWAMSPGVPGAQCASQSVRLWHTTDGARLWIPLSPSGIPDAQCKNAISFTSAQTGFISAYDPSHAPTILQTRDGGRTWNAQTLPDPPGFTSRAGGFTLQAGRVRIFGTAGFVDAAGNDGTAIRRYVYIWNSNAPGFGYAATVPNAEDAFAFAGGPGGGDLRWLLISGPGASQESTDGTTWHAFQTDYSQAAPVAPVVTFADGSVGYATVRGSIQRTTDGGHHWEAIRTPGT